MSDWANIGTMLAGFIAVVALGWQATDFIYSKRGFIVPKLRCRTDF